MYNEMNVLLLMSFLLHTYFGIRRIAPRWIAPRWIFRGELPPGKLPPGELPPGELPPGELPPGELPPENCLSVNCHQVNSPRWIARILDLVFGYRVTVEISLADSLGAIQKLRNAQIQHFSPPPSPCNAS